MRVLIVDDHPMWRDGVARDLAAAGVDVVGAAGEGQQAVRIAAATRPDVVLMDLRLPGLPGVEATAAILAADPDVRVLILSASGEHADVLAAVKAGASGYLVKSASAAELLEALERTARGEPVFTPGLAGLVLGEFRRIAAGGRAGAEQGANPGTSTAPTLTEREAEILRMVAKGLTSRQIATRLTLSPRTVENHVQNTLRKLQLHNRVELARYAIEQGIDGE
jgi:DNA-binding NarL/FixJ family response regulator